MQIITPRLTLKVATATELAAELAFERDPAQRPAFATAIGAAVTTWPPLYYDEAVCAGTLDRLTEKPAEVGWWQWYILLNAEHGTPQLAGIAGFHGPANAAGQTEIGYSVLEEYQGRGIATEAVQGLMAWAFVQRHVNTVTITTLDTPELAPSRRVAEKCGLQYVKSIPSDEGTILLFAISRAEYEQQRVVSPPTIILPASGPAP